MPPLSVLSLCDEGSRLPLGTSLPRGGWVKLGGLPLLWIHMGVHIVPLNTGSSSRSGVLRHHFHGSSRKDGFISCSGLVECFIVMGKSHGGKEGPISSMPDKIETTK